MEEKFEDYRLTALKHYANRFGTPLTDRAWGNQTTTAAAAELLAASGETVVHRAANVSGTEVFVYEVTDQVGTDGGVAVTVVYYDWTGTEQTVTTALDAADTSTEVTLGTSIMFVKSVTLGAACADEVRVATTGGAVIFAVVEIGDLTNLLYIAQKTDQVGTDGSAVVTIEFTDAIGDLHTVTASLDAADTSTAVAVTGSESFFRLVKIHTTLAVADEVLLVDGDATVLAVIPVSTYNSTSSRHWAPPTQHTWVGLIHMNVPDITNAYQAILVCTPYGHTGEETVTHTFINDYEWAPLLQVKAGSDITLKLLKVADANHTSLRAEMVTIGVTAS